MRQWLFGIVMAVTTVVLTASLSWGDQPVVFRAHNYGFTGPDRLRAGMTTMQIVNEGQEAHHIQVLELLQGKTKEDFRQAVAAEPTTLPTWVRFVGGPNAAAPGAHAGATMWLSEGEYLLICLIPNQQGLPHVALGMQKALSVVGPGPRTVSTPLADATITQEDFAFGLSGIVMPGLRTLRVLNRGSQPHEVVLVKLTPGRTVQEAADALLSSGPGPLPGLPIGGVVGIEKGQEAYFTADFEPGTYGVICFFPDRQTGTMHVAKGMTLEFIVR